MRARVAGSHRPCCVEIRTAVEADGGTFQLTQIKEKYGSIRAATGTPRAGPCRGPSRLREHPHRPVRHRRLATDHLPPLRPGERRVRGRRSRLPLNRGDFVYDPKRHECPRCGSREVQFALGVEEMPDQLADEIIESPAITKPTAPTWEERLRRPGLRLPECTCTFWRTRPSASAMSRSRVRRSGRTSASTATTRIAR